MDIEDFLTVPQAAKAIGADDRRAAYRALRRAIEAGETGMTVEAFGKMLVPKAKIETLKKYYFPYYSEQHQAMVKIWGARGGAASGVTKRARKKKQPRS